MLVDKPEGVTSHDAVHRVRRVLGTRRVGHTGTLDPMATGLLVILVGRATRLARFLMALEKRYRGTIRLGASSSTDDREGEVTAQGDAWRRVTDPEVDAAMRALEGASQQRPPAFSARKVAGERAYRLARRGEVPALSSREVLVHRFRLVHRDGPIVEFDARVGSGTYIRALARDLGSALGCGALLETLRRTAVGPFDVCDAVSLESLDREASRLRPVREAVAHLPVIEANGDLAESMRHGRPVPAPDGPDGPVAVLAADRLLAVAERRGGRLEPTVVLAP